MINLMKADLYRIFRSLGIYIAIAIVMIVSVISVVSKEEGYLGNASIQFENESVVEAGVSPFEEDQNDNPPLIRRMMAANINLYYPLVIVVFVILMADFSHKTMKNTLASAVSKRKYFLYKLLMSLGCSLVFILFSNLFSYLLNFIVNGCSYSESVTNILKATALQMPMLLGIVGFLLFMGFLTRKTAVYNAVTIPFVMVFQLIVTTIDQLTKSEWIQKYLMNFEWQTALEKLAYFPENKYCLQCLGLGIAEIVIFSLLSWCIFKKMDVK